MSPWISRFLLAFIVVLFLVRNLPWNLDDYDQAKQAYVSYEMVERGHWFFQHTPRQEIATKPPLIGWLSAGLHTVLRSWDLAWRLPPLLAALAMLMILWREGEGILPRLGGAIACGFFALNGLAPRLATLVRTDMPLTLFIFLIGWMIWRHVRDGQPWSRKDQWFVFLLVLATMLTKGPIVYAFLLPGLAAFAFLCRKQGRQNYAWSGSWTWFGPLLLFAIWGGLGAATSPEFYQQVVLKEFLGRFGGEVHKSQPWFFYGHLILRAAPWTFLLVGLFIGFRAVRANATQRLDVLWLICWALGGFILMSAIPSKRVDRIFPVLPPLALLLPAAIAAVPESSARTVRKWAVACIPVAALASGGYAASEIVHGYRYQEGALVKFGAEVQRIGLAPAPAPAPSHERVAVVFGRDEGMILYCGVHEFTDGDQVTQLWETGKIDSAVLPIRTWEKYRGKLQGGVVRVKTPEALPPEKQYLLVSRENPAGKISSK